jgi:hypothetical protein
MCTSTRTIHTLLHSRLSRMYFCAAALTVVSASPEAAIVGDVLLFRARRLGVRSCGVLAAPWD